VTHRGVDTGQWTIGSSILRSTGVIDRIGAASAQA